MAGRKLATTVYVHNEDGTSTAYGPEDTVPAEVAKKISNDDAWAAEEKSSPEKSSSSK